MINITPRPGWFSFGIAAIMSISVSLFVFKSLSNSFLPYRIKFESSKPKNGTMIQYIDLDGDNKDEKVVFKSHNGIAAIEIDQEEDGFYNVYKVGGKWVDYYVFFCTGDFDGDNLREIYLFTQKGDTLYLNGFEPFDKNQHFIKDLFISKIEKHQGVLSMNVTQFLMEDIDADGYKELFAVLQGAYALKPRQIVKYDIARDSLLFSAPSAASYTLLSFEDIDGNGEKEIITGTSATQNFSREDTTFLNDNYAWLVVYDKNLQISFMSRRYDKGKPSIYGVPVYSDSGKYIVARFTDHNSLESRLLKFNSSGELIDSMQLDTKDKLRPLNASTGNTSVIQILGQDGYVYAYDHTLKLTREPFIIGREYPVSYNTSDKKGWQVTTNNKYISILNANLNLMARGISPLSHVNLPAKIGISGAGVGGGIRLYLYDNISVHAVLVSPNPLYKLRLLINGLILLAIFGCFYGLFRLQGLISSTRQKREIKIQSLQLQNIQNQIQPHFTFNVLNTIGSLIYKENRDLAYEYLNNFSDLVRSVITSSENVSWTIDEELNFIETYIKLENVRYDMKFDFNIELQTPLDLTYHIPKLIVQTFVENAIKHGLVHKITDCSLKITLAQMDRHLEFQIIDNGIGRRAANGLRQAGSRRGLKIIQDYIFHYNKIRREKFSLDIIDLFNDEGVAEGTKVIIRIPIDYIA